MRTSLKERKGGFGKPAFLIGIAAALNLLAGCTAMPDRSVTTSSVPTRLGYPSAALAQTRPAQSRNTVNKASRKLVSSGYLGRAPYICTPSGFGKTSRCFLRG